MRDSDIDTLSADGAQEAQPREINLTPSWEGIVNEAEQVIPIMNPKGREVLFEEFRRMARIADYYIKLNPFLANLADEILMKGDKATEYEKAFINFHTKGRS